MVAALPMALALAAVTAVWVFGAVWSFTEQSAFATAKHFTDPALLPLVLDGLAISMAGVSFAASLDARPALGARAGTALAVLASATSNGLWAAERTQAPAGPDMTTVALGVGIPIAANIAFEVLLAELRRQVQRRRGLPAPVPLPALRPIRLLLDPPATFKTWRAEVLTRTAPGALAPNAEGAIDRCELIPRGQAPAVSDVTAPHGTAFETDPATPAAARPVSATPRGTRHDTGPDQTRPTHPPSGAAEASPHTTPPRVPAGRHVEVAPADAPLETLPEPEPEPEPEPLPEPEPGPEPEPSSGSRQDTASTDARVVLLGGELAQNPNMTGKDAETALAEAGWDTSYRTARRLLADARRAATTSERDGEPVADHEHARTGTDESVAPGAALSLVPHSPSPTSREGDI